MGYVRCVCVREGCGACFLLRGCEGDEGEGYKDWTDRSFEWMAGVPDSFPDGGGGESFGICGQGELEKNCGLAVFISLYPHRYVHHLYPPLTCIGIVHACGVQHYVRTTPVSPPPRPIWDKSAILPLPH